MKVAAVCAASLAACAPPDGLPASAAATYRCGDGGSLAVRFDNRADTATVSVDRRRVVLRGRRPASGIWYAASGYELRAKGRATHFTRSDGRTSDCVAD